MSTWIHLINPFESATRKSKRKMLILITDHSSRLQGGSADADILILSTRTIPVKLDYSTKYTAWSVANGQYRAETNRVKGALNELSSVKIREWDVAIQAVFAQDTPEYISLLPQRRVPFQNGSYDERITAVNTLGVALDEYPLEPALVTLKGEVDAYYTAILGKRNVQQQKEEVLKNASDALETSRLAAAEMMFRNLGILIDKYPSQPNMIANYYQLNLIQRKGKDNSVEYSGTLEPGEQKNVVSTGITAQSIIYFKNTGDAQFQIDLVDNPNMISPDATTVGPNEENTVSGEQIPELTAYFINLKNLNGSTATSYLIIVS